MEQIRLSVDVMDDLLHYLKEEYPSLLEDEVSKYYLFEMHKHIRKIKKELVKEGF